MSLRSTKFSQSFIVFTTLLLFILHFLPAYMTYRDGKGEWGLLYIMFFVIDLLWGSFIIDFMKYYNY